ncbi:MAG: aromatic-ring-hydroxylating dioxygenase subunit beta [Rhodospirillaceae bacterium]|nr:aromatic-ring-hydroxylating dioxygenase subunit beta [Rhodospirillaceae bacterium]|tara:strand:- start:20134 stop:20631 length:498 start_codon:yes stop_codon:yes gene_type:complete
MVSAELQHRVEQFLYREVRLLSELRLEEWLDLFTDDARYWMPARETVADQPDAVAADGEMAFFDDDKTFLAARIERLQSSLAHAERPPSRMRYFISNVEIEEMDNGELDIRCNLLAYQSRLERTEVTYVGRREDRLRPEGDSWRIALRKVILDQTLVPRTMSTFF